RYPAWNAAVYRDGYFNRKGGYAESGRVVAALAKRAQEVGIAIRGEQLVESLLEEKGRVHGVRLANGERVRAAQVVVSAGAWTPLLVPELQDVMRVVGQPV